MPLQVQTVDRIYDDPCHWQRSAKWMTSSTPARSRTCSWSLSHECLKEALRGSISPTQVLARAFEGTSSVDRLWILDIEGSRLVVDETFMPAASKLDQSELEKVAGSIALTP